MSASSDRNPKACIIPGALPIDANTGQKLDHIEATSHYIDCLVRSLNQHAMHVAVELAKHEKVFRAGDTDLGEMARSIVRSTSAILDTNMQKTRSAYRATLEARGT